MTPWPIVPLREVLEPVSRPESVVPERVYRVLGTRLYAGGLFVKEEKAGSLIRAERVYRVEVGDLVYNRLFAWKGSFAVAESEHDGAVVSNEFPCFRVRRELAHVGYLRWFLTLPRVWDRALGFSSGGTPTSRNRLKEDAFLGLTVPLPPLPEQERIVARIEAVAAKVGEVRSSYRAMEADADALVWSMLFGPDAPAQTPTPLAELLTLRDTDVTVDPGTDYQFAGVYSFGRGVFLGERKAGATFSYSRLTRLHVADFVYPKLMAWEGALGIVPPECDGAVVSPEFPVFELNTHRVLPEVLQAFFRNPQVWPAISGASTGTNVRRRRLHPSSFLAFKFPLPPCDAQQRARSARRAVASLVASGAQAQNELDSLLPAVLDHAFTGAL